MNSTGNLLKKARISARLTQKQVSDQFGFTTSQFISNIERGISPIPMKMLRPLAKLYKIPYSSIIDAMTKDYRSLISVECQL